MSRRSPSIEQVRQLLVDANRLFDRAETTFIEGNNRAAFYHLRNAADIWDVAADALEEMGYPDASERAHQLARLARTPHFEGASIIRENLFLV